ncbi:thiamine-binding protein, partial [Georgenia sp. 10Sc9-8]|nr:thiamine-binding protein [Georgenia halotolerans]
LPHETTAMFTTLEGDWEECMAVVRRATEAVVARSPRVSLVLKADIRPGFTDQLTEKVARVDERLRD